MELARLVANLEAATQPSRLLDCQIAELVGWTSRVEGGKNRWFPPQSKETAVVPAYTSNLQHAYELSQQILPNHVGGVKWTKSDASAQILGGKPKDSSKPALALCLAVVSSIKG